MLLAFLYFLIEDLVEFKKCEVVLLFKFHLHSSLFILVCYLCATLAMGFYLSRRQEDEKSFFLGNRNMPSWAVTISIVATSPQRLIIPRMFE